jgi:tensin
LKNYDEYTISGIYEIFGNSCTESLQSNDTRTHEVETEDLSCNSWYQSGLLGKFSLEMLKHQSPGSFIVHKASCKSNNFILSLRVPSKSSKKVVHHLILQSKRGYRIKGASKFFPSINSLVTHHSVMPEQLPITLIVQRNDECRKSNDDDFSSLDDLKIIFTDLED